MRETQEPTRTEGPGVGNRDEVEEKHPAFGTAGVSHISTGPGGSVLFDSDIKHRNTVMLTVSTATRKRDLNRDWIHSEKEILEIEMSEAQFGALVSSPGKGNGVPVTIRRKPGEPHVPGIPFESRMQESLKETRGAADEAYREIQEAFEIYDKDRNAKNRKNLAAKIANAPANVEFAGKSLTEHAENVVQKAQADIEAAAYRAATERGLNPADVLPELGPGKVQGDPSPDDPANLEELIQDAEVVGD